jgi:hypothetical protein
MGFVLKIVGAVSLGYIINEFLKPEDIREAGKKFRQGSAWAANKAVEAAKAKIESKKCCDCDEARDEQRDCNCEK